MHLEHPNWTALAVNPGLVQTDSGNFVTQELGIGKPPVTIEESVDGVLKQIDFARREEKAKFLDYSGEEFAW
jgi:norsolorinic acid ketoreductase